MDNFLAKKTLIINDCVIIQDGYIVDNPFIYSLESSKTIRWILKNKPYVTNLIMYWFREYGLNNVGLNVEDCFSYVINFFISDGKKEFIYFESDNGFKSSIKKYVSLQIKYCVHNYIKEFFKEPQATSNATDSENQSTATDTEIKNTKQYYNANSTDYYSELYSSKEKFAELDEKFNNLANYKRYFELKGFIDFDFLSYIGFMYFYVENIENPKENKSKFLFKQYQNVANILEVDVELVKLVTEEFKSDVYNRNRIAKRLFQEIAYLVDHIKLGWKPKCVTKLEEAKDNKKIESVRKLWITEQVQ